MEIRKSPLVRWPVQTPAQPLLAVRSIPTCDCKNSRSTWLSPLLITRSKPAKISLTELQLSPPTLQEVQPVVSKPPIWWAIASTLEISFFGGFLPLVPHVAES